MEKFVIEGGRPLYGEIEIQSAKNAVLPLLAASVLTEERIVIHNCPRITDVLNMAQILEELGCRTSFTDGALTVDPSDAANHEIPAALAKELRSSVFMLGSVLSRFGRARIAYPGGCDIGLRPIDLHLNGLRRLGVCVSEGGGYIDCSCGKIEGAEVVLDFPSVGATENVLLLAVKAEGTTVIHNAAREPEIVALARFLRACGAEIYGEGTPTIMIEGVRKMHGAVFTIPFDRIEAGTFLCAAAMTGGTLYLKGAQRQYMERTLEVLEQTGCALRYEVDAVYLQAPTRLLSDFTVATGPYPAFPTDMQPMLMSLLTLAKGTCMISETVFEARFRHAAALCQMGANIQIHGRNAAVFGVEKLHGARLEAADLRGGAALLLAALAAEGQSRVYGSAFVERGYEKIEDVLTFLGGRVRLVSEKG